MDVKNLRDNHCRQLCQFGIAAIKTENFLKPYITETARTVLNANLCKSSAERGQVHQAGQNKAQNR